MEDTFRFGSSAASCNTASSGRAQLAEDFDVRAHNNDPNKLIQCPYDKSHQIRVFRLPYHLVKCSKNHPELAKELQTCPYNARHLVPRNELASHTETCEDRVIVNQAEAESDKKLKRQVPVSTWKNPTSTEDWDEEVDDHATPFVWGTDMNSKLKARPTNNLGPSVRAPDTLPWATYKQ